MGTGNWGPSGCGRLFPLLFLSYMKKKKQLDIYIDESGDFSLFTKENPLYSVAFIMVKKDDENDSAINYIKKVWNDLLSYSNKITQLI